MFVWFNDSLVYGGKDALLLIPFDLASCFMSAWGQGLDNLTWWTLGTGGSCYPGAVAVICWHTDLRWTTRTIRRTIVKIERLKKRAKFIMTSKALSPFNSWFLSIFAPIKVKEALWAYQNDTLIHALWAFRSRSLLISTEIKQSAIICHFLCLIKSIVDPLYETPAKASALAFELPILLISAF